MGSLSEDDLLQNYFAAWSKHDVELVREIFDRKTTLANSLRRVGFERISASDCLRELYQSEFRRIPTRLELANYGAALRYKNNLRPFHSKLLARAGKSSVCSVDGLRFRESIERIRTEAESTRMFFLSCPLEIRYPRITPTSELNEIGPVINHATETSLESMRDQADLIIDASKPFSDVLEAAERAIQAWCGSSS